MYTSVWTLTSVVHITQVNLPLASCNTSTFEIQDLIMNNNTFLLLVFCVNYYCCYVLLLWLLLLVIIIIVIVKYLCVLLLLFLLLILLIFILCIILRQAHFLPPYFSLPSFHFLILYPKLNLTQISTSICFTFTH